MQTRKFDGTRLREWRERVGLSPQELARAAGCSRAMVNLLENGRKGKPGHPVPSLDLAFKLAAVLRRAGGTWAGRVTVEDLTTEHTMPDPPNLRRKWVLDSGRFTPDGRRGGHHVPVRE